MEKGRLVPIKITITKENNYCSVYYYEQLISNVCSRSRLVDPFKVKYAPLSLTETGLHYVTNIKLSIATTFLH